MRLVFAMLAAFILLTSATFKKPETNFHHKLLGKWKHTVTSGGYAGQTKPANSNVLNVIEFKKGGKYVRYVNNEPDIQGTYEVVKAKSIYSGKEEYAIQFDPAARDAKKGMIATIDGNKLRLADNFHDGFTSGYEKLD